MRSIVMPSRNHQTERRERLNNPFGDAKGTPLSERIACGKPFSFEKALKGRKSKLFAVRFQGFAQQ